MDFSEQSGEHNEIKQYLNKLQNWRSQPHKKIITDILIRLSTTVKITQPETTLKSILETLQKFHREANKSPKQEISEQWFKQVLKAKNSITKLLEQKKRKPKQRKQKINRKNLDEIKVPTNQNKHPHYQLVMELLYKHFVLYLSEDVISEGKKIREFLDALIKEIFDQFGFGRGSLNKEEKNTKLMMLRLDKLAQLFLDRSLLVNKMEMLEGSIDPKKVAKCDPIAFFADEARRLKEKRENKKK